MTRIENTRELVALKESGRRLAVILGEVARRAVPGISGEELNRIAETLIREGGDVPAFLGYKPQGARRPYPATLCVSVNDEVVHGIPGERTLASGDIVGLDLGLIHEGMVTDMAVTVAVGDVDAKAKKLISATEEALLCGIKAARAGATTGDIGHAIEACVLKRGFQVVEELGGHSVGHSVHEDPFVPNWGERGEGAQLKEGLVLALEPIVAEKDPRVFLAKDGYTFKTKDGKRSAHFEHTILITKKGAEIITKA